MERARGRVKERVIERECGRERGGGRDREGKRERGMRDRVKERD